MNKTGVQGLHHITALAGEPLRNYRFYTKILGFRLVKKTVNFDDPHTYHFYFGNKSAAPGSILTFFPYPGIRKGTRGTEMITEVSFSVPRESFPFWEKRFRERGVIYNNPAEKFGDIYLTFIDPDGLKIELTAPQYADSREPWSTSEVPAENALRGIHGATLTLNSVKKTADILTGIFGYTPAGQETNRYRFLSDSSAGAPVIDLVELPQGMPGVVAGGTVHHIAFRVPDEGAQMRLREKIVSAGFQITEQIDRSYFKSLYFREPGGVLFEIATDTPGFYSDEDEASLGTGLKLPPQHERLREEIESILPPLG